MLYFWLLIILSTIIVGSVMLLLGNLAREVPDKKEAYQKTRLNPDQLRLLAYALMVLVLLLATLWELELWY